MQETYRSGSGKAVLPSLTCVIQLLPAGERGSRAVNQWRSYLKTLLRCVMRSPVAGTLSHVSRYSAMIYSLKSTVVFVAIYTDKQSTIEAITLGPLLYHIDVRI